MNMSNRFDPHSTVEANEKLAALLGEPNGLQKLAADVLPDLIKQTRDYVGFARKVLVVDPVSKEDITKYSDGSFYKQYPKDIDSGAAVFGEAPEATQYKIEGELVDVPILTIMSDESTIDRKRLLIERLDYLERAKDKAGQAIAKLEDYRVLAITEDVIKGDGSAASPEHATQVVTTSDTALTKTHLVNLKKSHSRHDLETAAFVLNPATLDDILAWDDTDLDDTTRRELIESGVRYTLWSRVALIPSRIIDLDTVYAYADKEYTGVMPVLSDISSELTDTNVKLIKGLFLYEFVGFAIFNHRAVAKLIMSYTSGDVIVDFTDKATKVASANN